MNVITEPKPDLLASAQTDIERHCFSTTSQEVGGFLVGTVDDRGTHVAAALPAEGARASQVSMTFTHESWARALSEIAEKHPGLSIVGWYHSHPGFGLFLSGHDAFIQQNFFNAAGHVALVVDPVEAAMAWFYYDGSEIQMIERSATVSAAVVKAGDAANNEQARRRRGPALALGLSAAVAGMIAGWALGVGQNQGVIDDLDEQIATLTAQNLQAVPDSTEVNPETPVAGTASLMTIYTVQAGDTLTRIASGHYGTPSRVDEIVEANPGIVADELAIGQQVRLPVLGAKP